MERTIYNQFEVDSAHHDIKIRYKDSNNEWQLITNNEIVGENFTFHSALCGNGKINYGDCIADEVEFTVAKTLANSLVGKEIIVLMSVEGMSEDTFVNLGIFNVYSAVKSDSYHKTVKAKDLMVDILKMPCDAWLDTLTYPTTLYDFRDALADYIYSKLSGAVTFQSVSLPMDNLDITRPYYYSGSEHTVGDLLTNICAVNGVFGKIVPSDSSYDSEFAFLKLGSSVTRTLNVSNCSRIDIDEQFTYGVNSLKMVSQGSGTTTGAMVYDPTGRSNVEIVMKDNPFLLCAGVSRSQPYIISNTMVANVLSNIGRKPIFAMEIETYGNPSYWVGDVISVTDKDNITYTSYITERTIRGIQHMRDTITVELMDYPIDTDRLSQMQADVNALQKEASDLTDTTNGLTQTTNGLTQSVNTLSSDKLDKSGGTVTGALNVSGVLSEGGIALSNKYQPKGNYLPTSGGTVSGDLTVNGTIKNSYLKLKGTDGVQIQGSTEFVNDVTFDGDVQIQGSIDCQDISAMDIEARYVNATELSQMGEPINDLFASKGDAVSLEIDGYICPTINGVKNSVEGNTYYRRIARVDLGELEWTYESTYTRYTVRLSNAKYVEPNVVGKLYCDGYTTYSNEQAWNGRYDKSVWLNGTALYVVNKAYSNATTFKSAISGVYLYYELATEQTEEYLNNDGLVNTVRLGEQSGGRNLFDTSKVEFLRAGFWGTDTLATRPILTTAYVDTDGSIKGTLNPGYIVIPFYFENGKTISWNIALAGGVGARIYKNRTSTSYLDTVNSQQYTPDFTGNGYIAFSSYSSATINILPVLEYGTVVHSYEPYYKSNYQLTHGQGTFEQLFVGSASRETKTFSLSRFMQYKYICLYCSSDYSPITSGGTTYPNDSGGGKLIPTDALLCMFNMAKAIGDEGTMDGYKYNGSSLTLQRSGDSNIVVTSVSAEDYNFIIGFN